MKQERRGGIETHHGLPHGLPPTRKQERRGGIETINKCLKKIPQMLKQERRGGIETRPMVHQGTQSMQEAGTPWWH